MTFRISQKWKRMVQFHCEPASFVTFPNGMEEIRACQTYDGSEHEVGR